MKCPKCKKAGSTVIESRPANGDSTIRRRRACACGHRWTTGELDWNAVMLVMELADIDIPKRIKSRRDWVNRESAICSLRDDGYTEEQIAAVFGK